jgi:hypothetical protein
MSAIGRLREHATIEPLQSFIIHKEHGKIVL